MCVCVPGELFWSVDPISRSVGRPQMITDTLGISGPIDTVFTRCNCHRNIYIIKVQILQKTTTTTTEWAKWKMCGTTATSREKHKIPIFDNWTGTILKNDLKSQTKKKEWFILLSIAHTSTTAPITATTNSSYSCLHAASYVNCAKV